MGAGGGAADAWRGARLLPSATAEAPEEAMNFLRFMVHSISPGGVLGLRTHPVCAKSPWVVRQDTKNSQEFPQSVGISGAQVWNPTCRLPPECPGGLHGGQRNPHDYRQPYPAVIQIGRASCRERGEMLGGAA